jgi:hypothetical protein
MKKQYIDFDLPADTDLDQDSDIINRMVKKVMDHLLAGGNDFGKGDTCIPLEHNEYGSLGYIARSGDFVMYFKGDVKKIGNMILGRPALCVKMEGK